MDDSISNCERDSHRHDVVWLVCVLTLALLVRLLFLTATDFSLDADEAIVGLMAKHFNEGRPWVPFYYGQAYMGSLEPTLTALVFRLMGPTDIALKVIPLLFSLWFVVSIWALASAVAGSRAAKWASLFAALPPVALVEWSTKARGGFIELVFLGTVALAIAVRCLKTERPLPRTVFFLGLILGLAWWVNNQAIFYLAAIGVVFVWHGLTRLGLKTSLRLFFSGALGFFIGGSAFWCANFFRTPRFATFSQLGGRAEFGDAVSHFLHVWTESMPILLGARPFWSYRDNFPFASSATFVLWSVIIAVALFVTKRQSKSSAGTGLLLLFLLLTPLIFSVSTFGWLTQAPRYLRLLRRVSFYQGAFPQPKDRQASVPFQ